MDKLFEKALSFIFISSFLGLSFVIFNINEYEHKIKMKDLKNGIIIDSFTIPSWLEENSKCDEFSILKQEKYTITKCIINNEVEYFKEDNDKKTKDIKYLYEYNRNTKLINIYISKKTFNKSDKKSLSKIIDDDFSNYLGVKLGRIEDKSNISSFTIIKNEDLEKKIKIKNSFNLLK